MTARQIQSKNVCDFRASLSCQSSEYRHAATLQIEPKLLYRTIGVISAVDNSIAVSHLQAKELLECHTSQNHLHPEESRL
jgi:hypothetical protein